jgi:hypothetical protein
MCWRSTLRADEDEPDVFADLDDDDSASPAPHSRAPSESGDDGFERGSRASLCVADVDDAFRDACRRAEARHRAEMAGWLPPPPPPVRESRHRAPLAPAAERERERAHLYEIRALATRQY